MEHKTDFLARVADRVVVLHEGHVSAAGPATAILADRRLDEWGVEAPSRVRLDRAAAAAGVVLPSPTAWSFVESAGT